MNALHDKVDGFIAASAEMRHSRWIFTEYAKVYVRRGFHLVGQKGVVTFDIGDITVAPIARRQRIFTHLLLHLQEVVPWNGIYVENVHSPILHAYLERLAERDSRWTYLAHVHSFAWIGQPLYNPSWMSTKPVDDSQADEAHCDREKA